MARRRHRGGYGYSYHYYNDEEADPLVRLVTPATRPDPTTERLRNKTLHKIRRDSLVAIARLEDNRVWNPEPLVTRRFKAVRRSDSDLVPTDQASRSSPTFLAPGLSFREPHRVSVCAKRQIRREVLLAKGAGGGRHRPPRRKPSSDIGC